MNVVQVPEGEQVLSGLLQAVANEISVGRVDVALAILSTLITQLQAAGQ